MSGPGLSIEALKNKVYVSDESVERILASAERAVSAAAAWAERNPELAALVVLFAFAAFCVWMRYRSETRTMRLEFRDGSKHARISIPVGARRFRDIFQRRK